MSGAVDPIPVPLRFWAGSFRLASPRLSVIHEEWHADPLSPGPMPRPDKAILPRGAVGWFRRSEPCGERPPRLSRCGGLLRYVLDVYERQFIDLSGEFEQYLQKFSGKTRSTLKRKVRKFAELSGGSVDVREYRSRAELTDFHRLASTIAAVSYQERLFGAGLPQDPAFIENMQRLADQDRARGYLLFHADEPASYLYCPVEDGRVIYGFLGYRTDLAAHSPGTVLQFLALQRLFAERRYRFFDFTEGEGEHKRLYATHSIRCADSFYLAPRPRTLALIAAHWSVGQSSGAVAALLRRVGLYRRLRRLVRG